jgi:spore germination protein YaaH
MFNSEELTDTMLPASDVILARFNCIWIVKNYHQVPSFKKQNSSVMQGTLYILWNPVVHWKPPFVPIFGHFYQVHVVPPYVRSISIILPYAPKNHSMFRVNQCFSNNSIPNFQTSTNLQQLV